MLFDWFTFFAQLVNFLILVWLLKRFLYKPILNAIDKREKYIADQLQEAETLKKEANTELENFRNKNVEFDEHRQELLNNAAKEVDSERKKLLEQTRNEIEKLRLQLEETLRNEQQNLGSEIIRRTRTEVFSIVRKTLNDLASVSLEDQIAEVFINRIKDMDTDGKEKMLSAITKVDGEIIVRSTFELSQIRKTAVINILKKEFFSETEVKFETAPELVSGIELVTGGYKVVWSIDDYLVSLEEEIEELISAKP